jgi:hypothetical protein
MILFNSYFVHSVQYLLWLKFFYFGLLLEYFESKIQVSVYMIDVLSTYC